MSDFELFGDDSNNKEYEEMMAKKKAEAEAAKAKEKKEKVKPVLKSAVVLDVKPAEAEVSSPALFLLCTLPRPLPSLSLFSWPSLSFVYLII